MKRQFSTSYVRGLLNAENGPARLREIVSSESASSALGLDTPALILSLGTANTTPDTTGIVLESMKSLLANDSDFSKFSATAIADMVDPYHAQVAEFISNNADATGVAELFTQPLMESWGKKDPIAAATWLQTQEGKARDQGIVGLVSAISNLQPVVAIQWAISASDPSARRQAVGTVASISFSEIAQKTAVIMESDLSSEEKEAYVKLITR